MWTRIQHNLMLPTSTSHTEVRKLESQAALLTQDPLQCDCIVCRTNWTSWGTAFADTTGNLHGKIFSIVDLAKIQSSIA